MKNNLFINGKPVSVAIITNSPAPYRIPIYKILAEKLGLHNFNVIYCAMKEGNRDWVLSQSGFNFTFLKENVLTWKGRYIHSNFDVMRELITLNPDVVITTGFNPTFIFAFIYTILYKKQHIPMTDGTRDSERSLSLIHRLVRRFVFRYSKSFIGASLGSTALYNDYGIGDDKIFTSYLCGNNDLIQTGISENRKFDFMFSGRFSNEKNPLFALDVALSVAKKLNRKVSILMLGSGPLLDKAKEYASGLSADVDALFPGFVQQDELATYYCSAKVFLFPSSWDPWGVVANEACAAGQVVIVSPHAGVANDLIIDSENGYVLNLDLANWALCASELLDKPELLARLSNNALCKVKKYTYEAAADGIYNAVRSVTAMTNQPLRVAILQRRLPNYRVPFFEALKHELQLRDVHLQLIYGQPDPTEIGKNDGGYIDWADHAENHYFKFGDKYIVSQSRHVDLKNIDLVITTQENSHLVNYYYLLARVVIGVKVAFWGHGANFQSRNRNGFKERFKKWTSRHVDWWFAYTKMSADLVEATGFSADRITVLNNAVDTRDLKLHRDSISSRDKFNFRESLGLGSGPVGIFVGSLYVEKRLDFMFAAAEVIRAALPDFNFLIVGDGEDRPKVEKWCLSHPWAHFVGTKFGREKALHLSVSQIMLNPGLVGLGILDSFAFELPMLTTDCGLHSPEISYLMNDYNGIMTADDVGDYAASCIDLLSDAVKLERLKAGCRASIDEYSVENMAKRFANGVVDCLRPPIVDRIFP